MSSLPNIAKLLLILVVHHFELVRGKCEAPVKLYEDLYCKPIYSADIVNLCPKEYDCSHLDHARRIDGRDKKCYFDSKWYNIGDHIRIPSVCGVGVCKCTESLNFECTKSECPYLHLPDVNHCFLSYEFDQCCSDKFRCLTEWKNLSTCNVTGTIYIEGELFPSPLDNCDLCVCNKNYNTKYDDQVCRSVPCKLELFRSADILNNCAPVYLDPTDCCPVDVKCPSAADIDALKGTIVGKNDTYCQYGSVKLKIGSRLVHTIENFGDITVTECSCKIPPLVTCYRTYYS